MENKKAPQSAGLLCFLRSYFFFFFAAFFLGAFFVAMLVIHLRPFFSFHYRSPSIG